MSRIRCSFYFGSLVRKWSIFTLASFTPIPCVDTEERVEEKQAFRVTETKKSSQTRGHGHEEEGLLRTAAPVADRSEWTNLFVLFMQSKVDRPGGGGESEHMACLQLQKSTKMYKCCLTLSAMHPSILECSLF